MPYPDQKSRKLINEIMVAFADTTMPPAEVILGSCHCGECMKTQHSLAGCHWKQLLRKNGHSVDSNDMCVLNAKSWHFFLPAYLIHNIKQDDNEVFHISHVVHSDSSRYRYMDEAWRLKRENGSRQLRVERFGLLTKRQCQVVQDYVQYVAGRSEAKSLEAEMTAKCPERYAATRMKHQDKYAALLEFWRMQE